MKSTKTKRYVVEKKFRERYTKIQLRSSSQRSTKLPFESGTSRAISAVAILLCLSFLVSLVLQYWSVRSCNRKGLQETKQQLLFHSNQDQLSSNLCVTNTQRSEYNQAFLSYILDDLMPWHTKDNLRDFSLIEVNHLRGLLKLKDPPEHP